MPTTEMTRGRGSRLRSKPQTTFAAAATGTGAVERNVYSSNSPPVRGLEDDDIQGSAGVHNSIDARPAAPGLEDASFTAAYPMDLVQIGFALQELLGDPATSGAGPYVHTFDSGKPAVPVTTFERQLKAGQFRRVTGAVMRQMTLNIGPSGGYHEVACEYLARQVSDPYAASIYTSPDVLPLSARVPKSVGTLALAGTTVGRVVTGTLTLRNMLGSDRYAGDRMLSDVWREGFEAEISATVRYTDDVLPSLANLGADGFLPDPQSATFYYGLGAYGLAFGMSAVRLQPVAAPIQNGGAVTLTLTGRAEVSAGAPLLSVALTNNRATYA